ncbi:unnamed protein product, partial [Staurois parvus]
ALGGCKTSDLCLFSRRVLITCTLLRKKNSLAIHTKLSMCRMATVQSVLSGDKMQTFEQEEETFLHNAED